MKNTSLYPPKTILLINIERKDSKCTTCFNKPLKNTKKDKKRH